MPKATLLLCNQDVSFNKEFRSGESGFEALMLLLVGLTNSCLEISLTRVGWTYVTVEDNVGIKQ